MSPSKLDIYDVHFSNSVYLKLGNNLIKTFFNISHDKTINRQFYRYNRFYCDYNAFLEVSLIIKNLLLIKIFSTACKAIFLTTITLIKKLQVFLKWKLCRDENQINSELNLKKTFIAWFLFNLERIL